MANIKSQVETSLKRVTPKDLNMTKEEFKAKIEADEAERVAKLRAKSGSEKVD